MYTRRFALDFSVLEIQDQLLLLGLDQLRRFKCIIDLEQNVLVFGGAGGVQVPFLAQERVRRYIQRTPLDGCRPPGRGSTAIAQKDGTGFRVLQPHRQRSKCNWI